MNGPTSTTPPASSRRPAARSLAWLTIGALIGGAFAPVALAAEEEPTTPQPAVADAAGDNQVVIDVAKAVLPAVVTLEVTSELPTGTGQDGFGFGFPGGGFVQGAGSGVIIDPDGLILTNRHVVGDADEVLVMLNDGQEFEGTIAGVDTYTDLALVRIDASDLPTVELGDSSTLQVGQLAVAVGSPLGRFPGSVSAGIVSGLNRDIDVADMSLGATRLRHLIQTDAAINPGNSGGALVDGDGRLIGINTAMAGGAQGIGFALPIDIAKPIVEQVRAGEEVARPWMGVVFEDVDAQLAEEEDLPVDQGAWIHARQGDAEGDPIVDGSPAEEAGLQDGDIIVAIAGKEVGGDQPLDLVLLTFEPGETVTITVNRDGEEQDLDLTLGTRPADLGR